MLCFYRWSAQGKFFGRLGEDSISIYETPVSCHPVYSPKNHSLCGNIFLSLLSGSFHFEISWQDKWQVNAVHVWLHPLHHYSSSHILLTVLSTFCMVLARRICVTIRRFLIWWSFPFFLMTFTFDSRVRLWGDASHSKGLQICWITFCSIRRNHSLTMRYEHFDSLSLLHNFHRRIAMK